MLNKRRYVSMMVALVTLLGSFGTVSPAYADKKNPPPAIVHVEIADGPSLEDQAWPIIKSETHKHKDPSTGEEIIDTLVIRRSPPGQCKSEVNQTMQVDGVTVTCTYRTSETRSSSVLAGGVTGYAKNYADNYCGGSDCTYYKLTKLEIWWTRIGTGWVVRSANTAWGCNGSCAVCPNNTPYTTLYQSGYFTPNFNGGLTSSTYRYTSTTWPIMKTTALGIVWGGNNSTVESRTRLSHCR